jgi:MFS transporter, FHS family, glucose/mannose:H+ symporter
MYRKNLAFAAACLGMLLFGIVFLSLGAVANFLKAKFALDQTQLGTLTALLPLGILAGSLVFGPIVDRYGYKLLLILCALLVMLGLEGIAFARTFAAIQFCFLLIGFGGGILNGGTNALVADISPGERGAKLSLLGVFFGLGALGMPTILGVLTAHFSDEAIISGIGLFIVLPVAYFLAIRFPAPKQPQGLSLKESFAMLKDPALLLLGMVLFFQSGLEGATNDWSPVYLKERLNFADNDARLVLASYVAAMTATRLALGGLLKRISSSAVLFASIAIAAVGALIVLSTVGSQPAVAGLLLLGIGYAACFPVVLGYIGDRYASRSGTAFSIAFVLALIGNMSINKSMGQIAHHHGIEQFAKVLLGSLICITLFLALALWRMARATAATEPAAAPDQRPVLSKEV